MQKSSPESSPGRVTIRDVARHAGVGTMTVSRVSTGTGYVSEETRAKVMASMSALGYVPNELARGLRSKHTGTLALVVTDITNPFFTTVARGVEDAASDAGHLVLFCNTDENEEEEMRYMRLLAQKRTDGLLLVPALTGDAAVEFAHRLQMQVVVLDRAVQNASVDVVRGDSEGGAYELGKLLIQGGHRSFGILTGPRGVSTSEMRVAGFKRALEELGEPVGLSVQYGSFTHDSGAAMAGEMLAMDERPTAIFATNNFISIGAIQKLTEHGLKVPDDISIVGFDDFPLAMVSFPFLTVASQPAYEMGREAVRVLLERIKGQLVGEPTETILPTELLIRKSCQVI